MRHTRREPKDQKILLLTTRSQIAVAEEWRSTLRPIPSMNETIRRLIDIGLEVVRTESEMGEAA